MAGRQSNVQKVRDDRMHVIENLDAGLVQPDLSTSLILSARLSNHRRRQTGPGLAQAF